MNPRNITSSFSKREKMRRNPFRRRNRRSTSLRRLYISRSYSQGLRRVLFGGTTGAKPRSSANWRVRSSSYARSITSAGLPDGRPCLSGAFGPAARRAPDRGRARGRRPSGRPRQPDESWWSSRRGTCRWPEGRFFFPRPRRPDVTFAMVPSSPIASTLARMIRSRCRCSNTRSSTPFLDQRFIRVYTVCHLPNRFGSPRYLHPCSAT